MAFEWKAYNREQMRKRRALRDPLREAKMVKEGKCTICEMLLTSTYHTDCPLSTPPHTQDDRQLP